MATKLFVRPWRVARVAQGSGSAQSIDAMRSALRALPCETSSHGGISRLLRSSWHVPMMITTTMTQTVGLSTERSVCDHGIDRMRCRYFHPERCFAHLSKSKTCSANESA